MFIALSFSFHVKTVIAEDVDFSISHVYHTIGIMRNGYVIINDTIEISATGQPPNSFLIGFPYKYGSYILKCMAYNETTVFQVNLAVPLGERAGFYAVEVKPDIIPQKFTVLFILSNELLQQSGTTYNLDFPAYPSLTEEVENCSVKIDLPTGAGSIKVVKDGETITETEFSTENLSAFTYSMANVTFALTSDEIQLLDVKELKREICISGTGEIQCSDSYYITNEAPSDINLNNVIIVLPPNASNTIAYDQFGRSMSSSWVNQTTGLYKVNFDLIPKSGESVRFNVMYSLPSQYLATQGTVNSFSASSILFQNINYYIEKASLILMLPEGAKTVTFENTFASNNDVLRDVFQEILTINVNGASYLESLIPPEKILRISYEYNPLWLAFRPTLWIWALALVSCTVAFVWRRPKAVPVQVAVLGAKLQPEYVKSFVRMYEEKRKILFELDSLESRVRKGRIPRRRYKVQRKTFEMRLDTLERNLAEFKERMRRAGGLYADLMRQLEIAETQINEAEANIKSIEVRHHQGTLSLEAYRKLLADYQQRKDKAQMTINGILLRLREETR
jgi:hypothetical protein